ncbi:acetyl-CoA acyltransferase 1 [Microdochium nivale]|nr:acetyl-CoA acyltransferase 1 [Microdochium nivale]
MSADADRAAPMFHEAAAATHRPATPPRNTAPLSSQRTIASTEPDSPIGPTAPLKTESSDDHMIAAQSRIIPSSLTPPPSSQVPQTNGAPSAGLPLGYVSSQRAGSFSPPLTAANNAAIRRDSNAATREYVPPSAEQIAYADIEQLRAMFQSCLAENARHKMETAHHKLQYNLLSMQSEEDAKRATVEHDMIRREVEALRVAEDARQARRELSAAAESTHAKYVHLKGCYEALIGENDVLKKRVKSAKKVIQQKEDEIVGLIDERDMLLTRIRENREHFHMLCSPGGVFHGALTPKMATTSTPQQPARTTPRQTPKATSKDSHTASDQSQAGFAALLQALSHDNNSAPSTPISGHRPNARIPAKHTRGVQSLSALPTTPNGRLRGEYSALLPSIDLVPQTEPPTRHGHSHDPVVVPHTPTPKRARKSRESTISAEDNETLARAALEHVAAATQSYMSHGSRSSRRDAVEEDVYESHASQAASDMLRRDPRESFEIADSTPGSRDGTPQPGERSMKLQSKLFAGVNKPSVGPEKRKHSIEEDAVRQDGQSSPPKKVRYGSDGRQERDFDARRVGLGIRY